MKAKIAIVGVFLVAVLLILWRTSMKPGATATSDDEGKAGAADAAKADPAGTPVEISMMYSTEKKEWIEAAAAQFKKDHPEIKLVLKPKGSIEAGEAIVDDKEKPTVWSPADSMMMNLAASDWKTKGRSDLVATQGDDAPQSLVLSPIVFVIWEDRADALLKSAKGQITWKSLRKALTSPQGWAAIGGKPQWGFVKLGHTDPTKSNSGVSALYLMSLEWYAPKTTVDVGDLLKPDYQAFVRDIEKGVTKFESSTGTFMTDMVRFGPSKYDIAVVYENLAISEIENAQGRWGNLKIYYPQTTMWSDHPVALLQGDWVTDAQKTAGRTWIAYLRGRPMQERALALGFRPGDSSVPVRSADAQNPWTRLAQYGIQVDVPPVAKTPDPAVVRNLMTMWTRLLQP
jgi:hypothetical protein